MSEFEKDSIVDTVVKVAEKRGKKFLLWFGVLRTVIVLGGVFLMLERKTEAVFQTPAKQLAMQKQDDSVFAKHDSVHTKHNGYFVTIFNHVDTTHK